MQDLIDQLTSLSWWVGVIVVGVFVSLIAAYLKTRTDRFIGSISKGYRRRNEKKVRARVQQIEILRGDRHEQVMLALSVNHRRLRSIAFLLMGILVMIWALAAPETIRWVRFVGMGYGAYTIVGAFLDALSAISEQEILNEARQAPTSEPRASS